MWYFTTVRSLDMAFDIPNFTPAHTLPLFLSLLFSPPLRACFSQIFFRFFSFFSACKLCGPTKLAVFISVELFSHAGYVQLPRFPFPSLSLSLSSTCASFSEVFELLAVAFLQLVTFNVYSFILSFLKWNTFCYYFYYYYYSFSSCCCCCCCAEFHLRWGNVN